MAQYYYAVASLPMLAYDEEPFYTSDAVLQMCSNAVSRKDYRLLETAANVFEEVQVTAGSVVAKFQVWENALRSELARLRSAALGWEFSGEYSADPSSEALAREAFGTESPYQSELALQRARWKYLDELEVGHQFDTEALAVYLIRLKIIERNREMVAEKGRTKFDELYRHIAEGTNITGEKA